MQGPANRLPAQTVELVSNDTRQFSTVNLDGSYIIKNVAAGNYSLSIKSLGYNTVKNHAIEVKNGAAILYLIPPCKVKASVLDEVTIVTGNKESDHAARSLEKASPELVNMLSQKTIELLPDLTVANAMQRISGVSIQRSSSGEGVMPLSAVWISVIIIHWSTV
jgi:hypothetical protein